MALEGNPRQIPTHAAHAHSNRNRNILIVVIVLVLIVGGIFLWRYLGGYESTDDAQVDPHLYPVSARVSDFVTEVNVEDNQYVQKGTVLVEIDPKDYEVAIDEAKANLLNAEATAQSLNINVFNYSHKYYQPIENRHLWSAGRGRRHRHGPEPSGRSSCSIGSRRSE